MNNLEKRIEERFPNERIKVLKYTLMKKPAEVQCLNCNTIYKLSAGENFIRKNKTCICKKCVNNHSGGRLSKDEFEKRLKEKYSNENFKLISYGGVLKSPCTIQCLDCKNFYDYKEAQPLLRKEKNKICHVCIPNKNAQTKETIKKFLKYLEDTKKFILLEDFKIDNTKSHDLIPCICLKCGKINYKRIHSYLSGKGCLCDTNNRLLTNEQYQEELGKEYTLLSDYKGREKNVLLRHNLCGFCYKTNARNYTCKKCTGSKGEKKIAFLLESKSIKYVREYRVDIKNHILRFDFYIPKFDIFIEFNGEQHFRPIPFFGGEKSFLKQKEYDNYKKEWIRDNNKNMLVINYNEDIENKLFNYLLKFNDHPARE